MKLINKQPIPAGEFDVSGTNGDALFPSLDVTLDFTVAQPDEPAPPVDQPDPPTEPPPDEPDPPENGGDPPPTEPDPPPADPDPLPPAEGATHTVRATSVIDGIQWQAQAIVGEDPTQPGSVQALADPDGNKHPSILAVIAVDGCNVGAMNMRGDRGYVGSLIVDYDDARVYDAQEVQFYRGTANKTIRYGAQKWHAVDRKLFPNFVDPGNYKLPLWNLTKYDFSYNGVGLATTGGMANTGARPDIAYVPAWLVPFIVQPSAESWAVVNACRNNIGAWAIYWIDPDTGLPCSVEDYPGVSMLPYTTSYNSKINPIAAYTPNLSRISDAPAKWDQAHITGYAWTAAAATGSWLDRWHAAVWGNSALIWNNPPFRQSRSIWAGQERGAAWGLRALFMASRLSCMPDYFARQLHHAWETRTMTSPLGFQLTYSRGDGIAPWEEDYTHVVAGVVAHNEPEWKDYQQYLAQRSVSICKTPWWQWQTCYTMQVKDAAGALLPTWQAIIEPTLDGQYGYTAAEAAQVAATTDPVQMDALIRLHQASHVDGDLHGSVTACDSYPATARAAAASDADSGLEGAAAMWQRMDSVPTKPDFSTQWQWNIVPRSQP